MCPGWQSINGTNSTVCSHPKNIHIARGKETNICVAGIFQVRLYKGNVEHTAAFDVE